MSSEPATKRIKLELTDIDEPLTQKDVIAFQKEALYRCLNQHRTNLESLKQQYDLSKKQCTDISRKLANLMALVVTLARFLSGFCENEEEKQLCGKVSEGDETVIIQLSDPFMKLLIKYSKNATSADSSQDSAQQRVQDLATELKNLQKNKDEARIENKQLSEEITTLKNFYQDILRKYDREDSLTVNRVFSKKKLEDSEDQQESNNINSIQRISANDKNEGQSNNSVKQDEATNNIKAIKETDKENMTNENSNNGDLGHDIQMDELKSQLSLLKSTIGELEKYKSLNEKELIELRQKIASQQFHQLPKAQDTNSLIEKIDRLTQKNEELSQINEDFLSKFQQLSRDQEIYKGTLTKEFQSAMETLKKHNATLEKDLVRIRTTRDELLGKIALLEAKVTKSSMLESMQSALDGLKDQWNKIDERHKSEPLSQDALMKELQELEVAFKELSQLTHKKFSDYINQENIISKLTVEKAKADQKYFAAMRSKDSILVENKNLTKCLSKSNDLIAQLKDSEKLLQQKIENLNEQLHLSQRNERRLIESNKGINLKIMDMNSELSKIKKASETSKDENLKNIAKLTHLESQLQNSETELKALKLKASHSEAKCAKLQDSLLSDDGGNGALQEELENFRSLVYCSLCSKNWKNMTIKTCGHVFCEECCKERLASRMRKCPTCNKPFSGNDLLLVHL